MNPITEFLAGLTLTQYILLYLGCFALAASGAWIGGRTKAKVLKVLVPVFALLGGMLAIGYVTINMGKDVGLGILAVWAVFSGIVIFPALWLGGKAENGKPRERSGGEICARDGHEWRTTEYACTMKCARCGKTKVKHVLETPDGKCERRCAFCGYTEAIPHAWNGCRCSRCGERRDTGHSTVGGRFSVTEDGKIALLCDVCGETVETKQLLDCPKKVILAAIETPEFQKDLPALFCGYLGRRGTEAYSRGTARALLARIPEDRIAELIRTGGIGGQSVWALTEIADDALLARLCRMEETAYAAESEQRKRENAKKEKEAREHCPDGTPHEFGEESVEHVDRGPRGDDDLAAHEYADRVCRVCRKCGYKLYWKDNEK